MKFYDTLFEDYIASNAKSNLHPKLTKIYKTFPKDLSKLKNLIFYGPKGVGKYTQMLSAIKRYSPSELKYEKKMITVTSKSTHILKISDIHYEVDMSLLAVIVELYGMNYIIKSLMQLQQNQTEEVLLFVSIFMRYIVNF